MDSSQHSFGHDLDQIINFSDPVGLEDDLYYAELERQILQLTADDEEDDRKPLDDLLSPSRRTSGAVIAEAPSVVWRDFNTMENNKRDSTCLIKSNGTGVFIPLVVKSQTRNSSGRTRKNGKRKLYTQEAKNNYQRSLINYV